MRIFYPSLQAPVLTPGQEPEAVTYDRWNYPWSEPVRFKIIPALAIALAVASGQSFDPIIIPPPTPAQLVGAWFVSFTDPVRTPLRLTTGAQQFQALTEAAPFAETPLVSKWFIPFTDPVKLPPRLGAGLNQYLAQDHAAPYPETIFVSEWFIPFADPVRLKPDLGPQRQQFFATLDNETITNPIGWFGWLSDPVRIKPGLLAALQMYYTSYELPIPNYPWAPNYRLTVRRQDKRYIPIQGQAWTSPKTYPPQNEP